MARIESSRLLKLSALAILAISLAWFTIPRFRKVAVEGDQNHVRDAARDLERSVPAGVPLALLAKTQTDIEAAVLLNYYLYPRKTRLYTDPSQYHGDANAPKTIARIDTARGIRLMTYAELRNEWIGNDYVTAKVEPAASAAQLLVPLVASVDGAGVDSFTTEAVIENPSDQPVTVRLQFYPARATETVQLGPRQRRTWNDLLYQLFDVSDRGWLRLESDTPVRAGFWFVNRGRKQSAALSFPPPVSRATFDAPQESRLWFVNPHDRKLAVKVNGQSTTVEALAWGSVTAAGPTVVEPEQPIVIFLSSTDSEGKTTFRWSGI